jgi:26S proteasome regulatory subunit N10
MLAAGARLVILACSLLHGVGGAGLEATLIAVDNSGYMINSDHRPSRLQSQYECVNLVCSVKTQNPENTVGLMAMGCQGDDDCPRVLVTPATNQQVGPILISMSSLNDQIGRAGANRVRFEKAMRTAYLSLKHRANKNQHPRIVAFVGRSGSVCVCLSMFAQLTCLTRTRVVAFVGSPLVGEDKNALVKWGKSLRKNNVAVDIISFGESPRLNTEVLQVTS